MTLYPTHGDYAKEYAAAEDIALASGYLLQPDHDDGITQAQAAKVPNDLYLVADGFSSCLLTRSRGLGMTSRR